jgi:predicted NAD/FAD-dependent oxidoreductase
MSHSEPTDILIIGAGISGLLCATELQQSGYTVQLLEKGRGFGGRMATRRMGGGRLDHGAQYFTARETQFQDYVDQWLEAGIIKEWFRHLSGDTNSGGHPRFCGVTGMTDVPKYLAKNLEVHRSEQAGKLYRTDAGWMVETLSGHNFSGRHLVITAPLPQAMALLDVSHIRLPDLYDAAFRKIDYEKGLATLAILDGPSGLSEPGGIKVEGGILTWIADNGMKGISPDVSAVTLHADSAFAASHWDSPNELRGQLMLDAAVPFIGSNVVEYNCHRWGYAIAKQPRPERCFMDKELQLTLAGDSFGGPRIEGAALSGLAAASELKGIL